MWFKWAVINRELGKLEDFRRGAFYRTNVVLLLNFLGHALESRESRIPEIVLQLILVCPNFCHP